MQTLSPSYVYTSYAVSACYGARGAGSGGWEWQSIFYGITLAGIKA